MTVVDIPTPATVKPVSLMSHSRWSGYLRCPNQLRLRKAGYPSMPGWALIGGRSFHHSCDAVDYALWGGDVPSDDDCASFWATNFGNEIAEAEKVEPDASKWRTSGRRTKEKPHKEDGVWWETAGVEMVKNYVVARLAEKEVGFDIWEMPDGNPAIEVPIEFEIIPGVLVRGAIDRVMSQEFGLPTDGKLIRDLKTSQREPEDASQLGIYKVAMARMFGENIEWGDHFMAREGKASDAVALGHYTEDLFAAEYGAVAKMMALQLYPANPNNDFCRICEVKPACALKGGREADAWRFAMPR